MLSSPQSLTITGQIRDEHYPPFRPRPPQRLCPQCRAHGKLMVLPSRKALLDHLQVHVRFDLYAHAHKKQPTQAERVLWQALQCSPVRDAFKPQYPFPPLYIADFAAPHFKLIIEVDGESHIGKEAYDETRRTYFESKGYRVLYFTNRQVLTKQAEVMRVIELSLAAKALEMQRQRGMN